MEYKKVPSLPLLSCELLVSVKESPDRKKKRIRILQVFSTLVHLKVTVFDISLSLANSFLDLTYNETETIFFFDPKM